MKRLLGVLTLFALAALPGQAGVSVSVHVGGSYGGGYGYHGYSAGCYGGGRSYCYSGGPRYYGGYYGGYPYYSYGYAPVIYSQPITYGYDGSDYSQYAAPAYPYPTAPQPAPAPQSVPPAAPQPAAAAPTAATEPLATGKLDEFGFVHSPYSTTTFKAENVTDGQIFHDPITGQMFQVHVTKAQAPATPAPSGAIPTGKLDEFGYVHSPFSTFTFKVQGGNYSQTFHDPFTGQGFKVVAGPQAAAPAPTPTPAVASAKATD